MARNNNITLKLVIKYASLQVICLKALIVAGVMVTRRWVYSAGIGMDGVENFIKKKI